MPTYPIGNTARSLRKSPEDRSAVASSGSEEPAKLKVLPWDRATPVGAAGTLPNFWQAAWCGMLAALALAVHGYHPYAEDAAIYVPAIKKLLDPSLYPHVAEFFLHHSHFSLLAQLVALSVRVTGLPFSYTLLAWHLLSVGLILAAGWRICAACFPETRASLWGTALVAGILTVPIAGTSLLLADPYLTGRSLSTPALLFAIAAVLEHKLLRALLWLGFAFLMHPLMAVYGGIFLVTLFAMEYRRRWVLWGLGAGITIAVMAGITYAHRAPVPNSYRAAVMTRPYLFLSNWAWYEMFGLVAPMVLFGWLCWARRHAPGKMSQCSGAALLNGLGFLLVAAATIGTPALLTLARYQPLRSFHLIYVLMFLLPVNLGIQHLLRGRPPVLAAVALAALCAGMFTVAQQTFPSSPHVEWPWMQSGNPWRQAFDWARDNTPKDAVFALNPDYMEEPSEDSLGFRAYAERASLADRSKDGGVAAVFPELAPEWYEQTNATAILGHSFSEAQTAALRKDGATWTVVRARPLMALQCPYHNARVAVCRLSPGSPTLAGPALPLLGQPVPQLASALGIQPK